jgi:long-chain fatty acid transport protein
MYGSSILTVFFMFFLPITVCASGFQIPNQSVTAVGIAGANIASTPGPDSSYYNPANMTFLSDTWQMEASLTSLYLPSIDYTDNRSPILDGSSDSELFFLPLIHLSSKDYHDFRFGFSLTYPFGLAKNWDQPFPATMSEEFSLIVIEANPTVAYAVFDNFSVGGGIRFVYGNGEVSNRVTSPPFDQLMPLTSLSREMDGDDIGLGYNLAATLKPTERWAVAITYRSKVKLELDGDASLQALVDQSTIMSYLGSGDLDVNLPAVLSLATSYSFEKITLEIAWNRTFWSSFRELDFEYEQPFSGTLFSAFDQPLAKNWNDSDAIRLGATFALTKKLTTTLGFAYDQSPVPESTLGFELPDSDAFMYSGGLRYQQSPNLQIALSYMYQYTTSRTVVNQSATGLIGVDGKFTDGGAHAVNVGIICNF